MFSKISRYRNLPDVVTVDAKGRALASKSLRLLPEVGGTFLHTIEEIDRLDHLAYQYYEQPRNWWRIADANPAVLSPLALLGKEPFTTVQIPLTWDGPAPTWSDLLQIVQQTVGVEAAVMGTAEQAYAIKEIKQSETRYHWVVTVTYNNVKVATGDILDLVEDRGFSAGPPVEVGRVGKPIVIPPRVA